MFDERYDASYILECCRRYIEWGVKNHPENIEGDGSAQPQLDAVRIALQAVVQVIAAYKKKTGTVILKMPLFNW